MPTPTYDLIATTTLAAAAPSVVFGSLPQTYRDLILVVEGTTSNSDVDIAVLYNGDAGSNYNRVIMYGTGSSAVSTALLNLTNLPIGYNTTTSRFNIVNTVMDYSATDKHKTNLSRSNQADGLVMAWAGRWANTSAITSMSVSTMVGTFNSATTINLYGVIA
jgi:hypothetical protein